MSSASFFEFFNLLKNVLYNILSVLKNDLLSFIFDNRCIAASVLPFLLKFPEENFSKL